MDQKNPCDCCSKQLCDDCVLGDFNRRFECCNHDCMLNYEGSCMISIYDHCGAWKGVEANDQD